MGDVAKDLVSFGVLAHAFEHVPVGMAVTDADARILRANPAMAEMLGYPPEELIGKSVTDLTHPDDLAASLDHIGKLARGEVNNFSMDKRYVGKSGDVVWARVSVTKTGDSKNYLLHAVDVSREKRSEQAVEATEQRFREMADAIDQDFWMMNLEPLRLLYTSPAAARIWGFEPMSNRDNPQTIIERIHPDDLNVFGQLFGSMLTRVTEREYRIVRPDGAVRWLRSRVFPVHDASGNIYRVAGVTEDVTARKEAEQEVLRHRAFERLVTKLSTEFVNLPPERMQEGFSVALGELGAWVGADRGGILLLDREEQTLVIKYEWRSPAVSDHVDTFKDFRFEPGGALRNALVRDDLLILDSSTALPEDLSDVRERLVANRVDGLIDVPLIARGRLLGVLAFATVDRPAHWAPDVAPLLRIAAEMFCNVIERGRSDDAMRTHRDALAHVLRLGSMGQLASGIAHELNQPLSAILSYARGCERRLAAGDTGSPQLHGGLRKIAEQAVRAADVIKTLRALVRKGEVRRDWHDPNELVKAALRFIEPEVTDAGITLSARPADVLPYVQVDAIQIEQVILNLMRNALDAFAVAHNGSPSEIRVTTALRAPGEIEIAVSDTGCGIDAEEADYIFDEFFTTKVDGLGLGLSISRSIIEAHGGELWLAESSNTGTTFRFTLPAAQQPTSV